MRVFINMNAQNMSFYKHVRTKYEFLSIIRRKNIFIAFFLVRNTGSKRLTNKNNILPSGEHGI